MDTQYIPFFTRPEAEDFATQVKANGCNAVLVPTHDGVIVQFWSVAK